MQSGEWVGLEEAKQLGRHGIGLLDHEEVGGTGQCEAFRIREPTLNRSGAVDEAGLASFADNVENGGLDPLGKLLRGNVLQCPDALE